MSIEETEILTKNSQHAILKSDANGFGSIGFFEVSSVLSFERIRREKGFRKYHERTPNRIFDLKYDFYGFKISLPLE